MEDSFEDKVDKIYIFLVFLSVVSGVCILAWQIIMWLKMGFWTPIYFSHGLEWLGFNLYPVYFPSSWFGVAKIIQVILKFPLWFCLPVILSFILFLARYAIVNEKNLWKK